MVSTRPTAQSRRFQSTIGLLANARCLSEGVDVPALDGIAFIDPRASQVDIIQAVGRAIRRNEGKKVGTIVLPVKPGKTVQPVKDDSLKGSGGSATVIGATLR